MISKSMFNMMQYNENDMDLTQTAKLTTSKGMGCTTYQQLKNMTTTVVTKQSIKEISDFVDLWFGKIIETNALIKDN